MQAFPFTEILVVSIYGYHCVDNHVNYTSISKSKGITLSFTTLDAVMILDTARQLLHHPRLDISRPREFFAEERTPQNGGGSKALTP